MPKIEETIQKAIHYMNEMKTYENFIKPRQIILGWDCDENNTKIIELRKFCNDNLISIVKLNGYVDYKKDMFGLAKFNF